MYDVAPFPKSQHLTKSLSTLIGVQVYQHLTTWS